MLQSSQAYPDRQAPRAKAGASAHGHSDRLVAAAPTPDAGHLFIGPPDLRASFRPPIAQSLRAVCGRPLARVLLVLAAVAAVAALAANSVPEQPLEATVQMERLAVKMERSRQLTPETIEAVARMMSHPAYDCRQVPCRLELQQRNQVARARLEAALSAARPPVQDASTGQSSAQAMQQGGF